MSCDTQPFTPLPPTAPSPPSPPAPPQRASMCNSYTPRYFVLFLVLTFHFCGDFLGVVFLANVTIFFGEVFSAVVKVVSCFLLFISSNSCLVLFNFILAAVYFFFSFSVFLIFLYIKSERLLSVTRVCASMVCVTVPMILC